MDTPDTLVALADYLSDGIIVADEASLVYANARGLMLLGADSPEEVIGQPLTRFVRPDDVSQIFQSMSCHEGDNSGTPIWGRLLRADGRTMNVRGISLPILWEETRPCRLLVLQSSHQTDAGEEAMDQREVYRESVQTRPRVGSWERDLSTGVEIWSDEYCRILGYEPGTILPTLDTFAKALHQDDRDRVRGAIEQSLASDTPYDVECRIIQPHGGHRIVRCRGVVIRNIAGDPVRILGSVQDQTADTPCERSDGQGLRKSDEWLDLVSCAGHVGMCDWDHRFGHMYWSPILRDLFGLSADVPASLRRYVKLIHRADRERILAVIRAAKDSAGDARVQVEHRIVRPDGTVRHLSVHVRTGFEGEGSVREPSHTMGTVVDVTDHALAEAYRCEASKLMMISTLAGGIAHEFNNNLTAVLGFSQLALPLVPADTKAYRHIQQVIAAGRISSELVHQLVMFSRQTTPTRHSISVPLLVRESVKLLRSTIPSWIELNEQITASTGSIEVDETEMRRMLIILMIGAVQAMHNVSGVVGIELRDVELSTDMATASGRIPAGRYLCLRVKDSGEKLEPQTVTTFNTTLDATNSHVEARAIGLSVARDIAAAHGGVMTVDSRVGLGTTVSVYLPMPMVCPPLVSNEEASLPRGHEGILLVTAEESSAKRGRNMLQSLGYYTVVRTSAASARAAFNLAPRHFDLLIVDQTLSDMTGDQLARECRRLRPDLPVILCIGSEDALSVERAHSLGIAELMPRPFVLHESAYVIRRVLDRSLSPSSSLPLPSAADSFRYESPTSLREVSDAIGPCG
ncbi:MAG: PAS domain-containing protein [Nitrospira sp.]|nr:PAS domain-containing protein [Nitrospira sp.]